MAYRKFFVIVTDDGEPSKLLEFQTLEKMKPEVQKLYAEKDKLVDRQVYVIYGERWNVTKPPFPYLVPPHGDVTNNSIPLFEQPAPGAVDEGGFLHAPDEELDPQYAKVTQKLLPAAQEKEGADEAAESPF